MIRNFSGGQARRTVVPSVGCMYDIDKFRASELIELSLCGCNTSTMAMQARG